MSILIIIVHIVVALALILIVLLQTGKGADMGAAFGGGSSQTLFGSTGASTFLSRLTTVAAIVFMLTSLALAYMSGHRGGRSIVSEMPAPVAEPTDEGLPQMPVQAEGVAPEDTIPGELAPSDRAAAPAEPESSPASEGESAAQ
jgi:preprotein translocase subunit SecG